MYGMESLLRPRISRQLYCEAVEFILKWQMKLIWTTKRSPGNFQRFWSSTYRVGGTTDLMILSQLREIRILY